MLNDEIKTANTNEIESLKAQIAELEEQLRATNTGDWNTGNCNTGNWNTGDWNTGDYNTGDYNTGCFNTTTPKIKLFNKDSDWDLNDWIDSKAIEADNTLSEEEKDTAIKKTCKDYMQEYVEGK